MAPSLMKDDDLPNIYRKDIPVVSEAMSKTEPEKATKKSLRKKIEEYFGFKTELKWASMISISLFHIAAVVALFYYRGLWATTIFEYVYGQLCGFGITGGAHRLWTHKAYKAKLPLRVILMICFSAAGQNTLFDWVRDHRVHHKYSETEADPHDSNRGFFFAHVGWLMMKKHPEVIRRGRQMDMSDINEDPVVQFHMKHFSLLKMFFCFFLPTVIPMYFWNETFKNAFLSSILLRYVASLNCTWLVNSLAHISGNKPYDKRINPAENAVVSVLSLGEGWHNYHHAFPWDYKAAELGRYSLNITTMLIDFFAKIGWAYDLKQPSKNLVMKMITNHGDGTHSYKEHLDDKVE